MRRLLSYSFIVLLTAVGASFAPAATISIQPSAANVSAGDTFSLNIAVSGITDLAAFQLDLAFDPAILSAQSITEGPFLPLAGSTFFIAGTIDNVAGTIVNTGDALAGPGGQAGSGAIAIVQFMAIANGTSVLSLRNIELLDSTLAPITASPSNGLVIVGVPEPGLAIPLFLALSAGALAIRRQMAARRGLFD